MSNIKEALQQEENCGWVSALASVYSPIAEEIKDKDWYNYTLWGIKYVPFLEGGDASFSFFSKMRQLSPTQGACIESIGKYCFGNDMRVVRKSDGFVNTQNDTTDVSQSELASYLQFVNSFTTGAQLLQTAKKTYQSYKTFGNSYLEVVRTKVAGTPFIQYRVHGGDRVRYKFTESWEPKMAFISPSWDWVYIQKYPPKVVAVYPFWTEEPDGTQRTIIHLKNETIERDWYGEPDSVHGLYFQYSEYQQGKFTTEDYDTEFTAKFYIETSGDTQNQTAKEKFDAEIARQFTNRGEKKRVMHRRKGVDIPQSFIHEFGRNDSHELHVANSEIAEKQIIKAHDWHPALFMETPSGLGGEKFLEIFEIKNVSVILPMQATIFAPIRLMLDIAAEWLGYDQQGLTLEAVSPYSALVEQRRQSGIAANTNLNAVVNNPSNNPSNNR